MSFFLFPRHFDDVEVPVINGKKLNVAEGKEYDYYLNWLADHLFEENSKAETEQPDFKKLIVQAKVIGEKAWYHLLYCYEPFIDYIEMGADYPFVVKEIKKDYDDIFKDSDDDTKDDFNDWINPEVWENAKREYTEISKTSATHADLGYRNQLGKLLKGVKSHDKRFNILAAFYTSFVIESSK